MTIYLVKIDLNDWWSLIITDLRSCKHSWKRFTPRTIKWASRDEYPIGCNFWLPNEPWFFSKSASNPADFTSIFNLNDQFGSIIFRTKADVIKFFNVSIAFNWGFCKLKTTTFVKTVCSGAVTSVRFGMNFPGQFTIPKNVYWGLQYRKTCYCINFRRVNSNALWGDYMSHKYNRFFTELKFIFIKFQTTYSNFKSDAYSPLDTETVFFKTSLVQCRSQGNHLKRNLPMVVPKAKN